MSRITNPRVLFGVLGYVIRAHFPDKGLIPRRFRDNFLALPKGCLNKIGEEQGDESSEGERRKRGVMHLLIE